MTAKADDPTRKAIHLAAGGFAFLLKYLTAWQAAVCAAGALLFNRFVLAAVGGRVLFRAEEVGRPWRSGIVLYPASVLALIGLFHDHLEVAAASWGIMAAGDSAAGFVGSRYGRRPLPWNRRKTIAGSVAFVLSAVPAAWALLAFMGREPAEAALYAMPTACFAAVVESLPWRADDNLSVPLLSGLFLRGIMEIELARFQAQGQALRHGLLIGAFVSLVLAYLARRAKTVDRSGMFAGFVVGTLTYTFLGGRGFLVLLAFFVLGSAATRLGYGRKSRAGVAQERRGARSARHALANCGAAVYLAFMAAGAPAPRVFALAFVCAYATAAFDTVSGEVGQAYGGRPILVTTLRPVPVGTDGAISWIGTVAGGLAALAVGLVAGATRLLPLDQIWIVALAGFTGSMADSYLGATLERRGLMDNETVNFTNTLVGAITGVALATVIASPV